MASSTPLRCDLFCNVIDNYGDIGVCWRLARQLSGEHGLAVRLWVDELPAFARICPDLDPRADKQIVDGIEICRWVGDFQNVVPGNLVIEAFACHLPDTFIEAMAMREPKPVWLNLDYLSAEDWVSGCHALPSPHPRLPITKYFFFPGFDETTGGLLRENGLIEQRDRFLASANDQAAFWQRIGSERPPDNTLKISLFAYENPALQNLLSYLSQGDTPVCCLVPVTRTQSAIESFLGWPVKVGDVIRQGALEIRMLPFVPQEDYDRMLWLCDLNFVRGEDSFVRAQWAARPMVWQIYPQSDEAHRVKLDAFLDRYCVGLPEERAIRVRRVFHGWNGFGGFPPALIADWLADLPAVRGYAENWQKNLSKQQDLCSSLVRFCKSKL